MNDACSPASGPLGLVGSVSHFVDCQSDMLGSTAYGALASPGSTLSFVLTGFLTIAVALIGLGMLTGRGLDVRTGTLTMVKIGAVLALATSWPVYRTLVYDVVVEGPAQLVQELGAAAPLPGTDGTLTQRLDFADASMQRLAILGPGDVPGWQAETLPPPPFAGFNAFALGGARIIFLLSALAALVSVRIVAAIMLALGPFFVAFMLFDGTRSLFEGWIRALGTAAIAMIGVTFALCFELAILEPWLAGVLTRRISGEALPSAPAELFVITALFALVLTGVMAASARLATAFRLAPWRSSRRAGVPLGIAVKTVPVLERAGGGARADRAEVRSRAVATAGVVASLARREARSDSLTGVGRTVAQPQVQDARREGPREPNGVPIGRSFNRRAKPRASASAGRRDRSA